MFVQAAVTEMCSSTLCAQNGATVLRFAIACEIGSFSRNRPTCNYAAFSSRKARVCKGDEKDLKFSMDRLSTSLSLAMNRNSLLHRGKICLQSLLI